MTQSIIKNLGIEAFGIWSLSNAFIGLAGVFFNFGLGDTVTKYIAQEWTRGDFSGISGMISIVLLLNLSLAIFIGICLFLFSSTLAGLLASESVSPDQVEKILQIASFGLTPLMLRGIFLAIPKGFQDYRSPILLSILNNIVLIGITFIVTRAGGEVDELITASIYVSWVYCGLSMIIARNSLSKHAVTFKFSLKKLYLKKVFVFSTSVALTLIGNSLFSVFDRITVGMILGLSAAGYYTIAVGIVSKLPVIGNAITQSLMPAFSAWKNNHSSKELVHRLLISTVVVSTISFTLAIILIIFSRPLLTFWLGMDTVIKVLPSFRILIVFYSIAPCVAPAYHAANGLGYPWINTISTWLMGVFTIVLILILGRSYGIIGTAWANGAISFLLIIPALTILKIREKSM